MANVHGDGLKNAIPEGSNTLLFHDLALAYLANDIRYSLECVIELYIRI